METLLAAISDGTKWSFRKLEKLVFAIVVENPLAEARLVVSGSDVLLAQGREELVSVLNAPGQGVLWLVLDLPKVVEELREGVGRLFGQSTYSRPWKKSSKMVN